MRINFLSIRSCLFSWFLLLAVLSLARGDDRFSVAVGSGDTLAILAPDGARTAQLSVPTISQPVKIGGATFKVSYGRDANDLLTVVLTPDPAGPQSLHFSVLGKKVDTDGEAVVTLTFSRQLDEVTIDPGYVGTVQVDSQTLRHHNLSDENTPASPGSSEAPLVAQTSGELAPNDVPPSAPGAEASAAVAASSSASNASSSSTPTPTTGVQAPAQVASSPTSTTQAPPLTASMTPPPPTPLASVYAPESSPSNAPSPEASTSNSITDPGTYASQGTHPGNYPPNNIPGIPLKVPMSTKGEVTRYYWSEPITPPNGQPPPISIDEIKLVEVYGTVTVTVPGAPPKPGVNGMVIPSGAHVQTAGQGASAALFIGGVDSARLLPGTDLSITQRLHGAVRHTKIDLRDGTVFSRVGRRAGEQEDFAVSTPEGVAAARGTEFAVCVRKDSSGNDPMYVFVLKGVVDLIVNGSTFQVISSDGTHIATGSMPPSEDEKTVLMELLQVLQQFNVYLNAILAKLNGASGVLTDADKLYFAKQLQQSLYLVDQLNQIIVNPAGIQTPYDYLTDQELRGIIPAVRRAIDQEFEPFGTGASNGSGSGVKNGVTDF